MEKDVIIVGGGIAGLSAACYLEKMGFKTLIIEASDRVGGRVKTDFENGFALDRGFQVLLSAYPEARRLLDFEALDLKYFSPGAIVLKNNGKKDLIADPMKEPSKLFPTLFSSAGTLSDKLRMLKLKTELKNKGISDIFKGNETSTADFLEKYGFSKKMISSFFQPFFGGIFLEKNLLTSSRMFQFIFKMFSEGYATIPNLGMEQIPLQLKNRLKYTEIFCNEKVLKIEENTVFTDKNRSFTAKNIVIATEGTDLIAGYKKDINTKFNSTSVMYFSAEELPFDGKYIALNTSDSKTVNYIACLSDVAEGYAPKNQHLIALCTIGLSDDTPNDFLEKVKTELKSWFGEKVNDWKHLKTVHVPYSLPSQEKISYEIDKNTVKIRENLYICGDHLTNSSLNAAMLSGRIVAECIASSNFQAKN
jgi:phytoene dehydrogenase-like protein